MPYQTGGALVPSSDVEFAGAVSVRSTFGYQSANAAIGGAVTQITNRTTAVTLNTLCGTITTHTASLAAELAAEFTVNNNQVALTDVVVACQQAGTNGGDTDVYVSTVAAGSFKLKVANNNASGGTAETGAIIINFVIVKSVAS